MSRNLSFFFTITGIERDDKNPPISPRGRQAGLKGAGGPLAGYTAGSATNMATAVSTEQWPRHTDHFLDEARDYNVSSGALPDCESIPLDYDPYPASVFSCLALFGLVFVLYGYRAFKLTMFLTGFMFATLIVYKVKISNLRHQHRL